MGKPLNITGANSGRHASYPDRHVIHFKLAAYAIPTLQNHQKFLLVDTVAEAFEPIIKVLPALSIRSRALKGDRNSLGLVFQPNKNRRSLFILSDCNSLKMSIAQLVQRFSLNQSLRLKLRTSSGRWDGWHHAFRRDVLVCDMAEDLLQTGTRSQIHTENHMGWKVLVTKDSLTVPEKIIRYIADEPRVVLVHSLPENTAIGADPPAGLIIGHQDVLEAMKFFCNVVWYNMDLIKLDRINSAISSELVGEIPLSGNIEDYSLQAARMASKTRFDFNETRTQPCDAIQKRIESILDNMSHDDLIAAAYKTLDERHNTYNSLPLLFRGANEAIKESITSLVRRGSRALIADVGYIGHVKALVAAGAEIIYAPVSKTLARDFFGSHGSVDHWVEWVEACEPDVVVLSNPSNPLGEMLDAEDFETLLHAVRRVSRNALIFVDAAFEKFAHICGFDVPKYVSYMDEFSLIVIESLSKSDGFAGSRAGFIYSRPDIISRVSAARWVSPDISALGAATIVVSRSKSGEQSSNSTVRTALEENRWVKRNLEELNNELSIPTVFVRNSVGSFSMVKLNDDIRDELVVRLRDEHNLDVALVPIFNEQCRQFQAGCTDVEGKPMNGLIRLSPGTRQENIVFLTAARGLIVELCQNKILRQSPV